MKIDIPCEFGDTAYYLLTEDKMIVGTVIGVSSKPVDNGSITRISVDFPDYTILSINLGVVGTRLFFDETEAAEALEKWRTD